MLKLRILVVCFVVSYSKPRKVNTPVWPLCQRYLPHFAWIAQRHPDPRSSRKGTIVPLNILPSETHLDVENHQEGDLYLNEHPSWYLLDIPT